MKHERNIYRRNERDTVCPQLLIIPTTLPRVSKIGKTQSICSIILMTTMHTPSSPFCFHPWLSGRKDERMSTAAVSQWHMTYNTSPDIPQRAKPVLMETCILPNTSLYPLHMVYTGPIHILSGLTYY